MQSRNLRTREERTPGCREAQQLGVTFNTCLVWDTCLGMLTGEHDSLSNVTLPSSEHSHISYMAAQVFPKRVPSTTARSHGVQSQRERGTGSMCLKHPQRPAISVPHNRSVGAMPLLSSLAHAPTAEGPWPLRLPRHFSSHSLNTAFPSPTPSWGLSLNALSTERSFLGAPECLSQLRSR